MRSNFWKDFALFCAAFLVIFALGLWAGRCRGDEVHASPQSSSTWRAASAPRRAADGFSTPPTDGPNPPEVKDPGTVPPPTPTIPDPNPSPEPTPKAPGKSRLATTAESEGGTIINSNSGVIYLNSPGALATPSTLQAAMPTPTMAAYPLIPGPLTDQQYVGLAKRIGGGLYYAVTGCCPGSKATPAASPQVFAMMPTQGVQAFPVQMMQAPAAAPVAAPMYVMAPQSPVYAAPQYAVVPETPKKKCWLFGK